MPPLQLSRVIITPESATSVNELFSEAVAAYDAGDKLGSVRAFDRLARAEPEGALAPYALLNAAHVRDELGQFAEAAVAYDALLERFPAHALSQDAALRALRLRQHLEQWPAVLTLSERLLGVGAPTLRPLAEITLRGARALALLELGREGEAEEDLRRALHVIEAKRLDEGVPLSRDVAVTYFASAELARRRAAAIGLSVPVQEFPSAMEARCSLILQAQRDYSQAMRARDAHWSTMSGFRVGELYQSLHEALMQLDAPAAVATPEHRSLFRAAMRVSYSVLLRKGLAMMRSTLMMADRTEERSPWVERAREAEKNLMAGLAEEQRLIDESGYTREELDAALAGLGPSGSVTSKPLRTP